MFVFEMRKFPIELRTFACQNSPATNEEPSSLLRLFVILVVNRLLQPTRFWEAGDIAALPRLVEFRLPQN